MSELIKAPSHHNTVAVIGEEADNIITAASEDAGIGRLLKFKKGLYTIAGEPVPASTEFIAHCSAWTKTWVRFEGRLVAERLLYRVAAGEKPVDRNKLGFLDESQWPLGLDAKPSDLWTLQYLLPLENASSGELCTFTTSSIGGRRAVAGLCQTWARHVRKGAYAQPIIELQVGEMNSAKYGKIPAPEFEVVAWDAAEAATDNTAAAAASIEPAADFDDTIPF